MILAIGMDAVEIHRFADWHTKPHHMLRRVFSQEELSYCLHTVSCSAQRFAVRFAAKEACTKALSIILAPHRVPLLAVCKAISIAKHATGIPYVSINWQLLAVPHALDVHNLTWHISLTHAKTTAIACVVVENNR